MLAKSEENIIFVGVCHEKFILMDRLVEMDMASVLF
jgi:hypothetical protein